MRLGSARLQELSNFALVLVLLGLPSALVAQQPAPLAIRPEVLLLKTQLLVLGARCELFHATRFRGIVLIHAF